MARTASGAARKSLNGNGRGCGTERARESSMVLLVTSSARASECAAALQQGLGHRVEIAASLRRGLEDLRRGGFAAVVVDEILADANAPAADSLYREIDGAVPVTLNLAISGTERVVREVRSALRRHALERRLAQRAAARDLRSEVNDALTGILLASELALQDPGMPAAASEHIRTVHRLASALREKLG